MAKEKDVPVRISQQDHRWLSKKSDETQIAIRSILGIAIKALRGEPATALTVLFRDKKGAKK